MPTYRFNQGDVQLTVIQAQQDETVSALDLIPKVDFMLMEIEFERIPQF